jgi:putative superfamily III holin-X
VTETVDPEVTPPSEDGSEEPDEDGSESEEPEEKGSVTELLEQLGRDVGVLALSEAQLETSRNMPGVKRAARDVAGVVVVVLALLTAFVFVNVAAVSGLASVMPTWLAALVLAAAWVVVGGALSFPFLERARRWPLWRVVTAGSPGAVEELADARDEAAQAVRTTLERLGPAVMVEIAAAAVPAAGDIAEGVLDVGDGLLEASDDIVEAIADEIPAGSVVNQIWDIALMPGRFGLRIATTVLKRDDSGAH